MAVLLGLVVLQQYMTLFRRTSLSSLSGLRGAVQFISKRHQWFTFNRINEYREIKDPFEQAQACMYELLRQLKGCGLPRFTIGCAAVFPDISRQDAAEIAENCQKPGELILDRSKIEGICITTSIEEALKYHKRSSDEPLGQAALDKIINRYRRSWFVPSLLLSDLSSERKCLEELTEQQFVILDALSNHSHAAIYGFAGTGKTFLAMEKARQLARSGMSVLLVCYNAKLADALWRQLGGEAKNEPALANIEVHHFHALVKRYCDLSGYTPTLNYSDESYAKALLRAAKLVDKRFDAILADEGQDFQQNWWEALQALLKSGDSLFYVFYDNRQNIFNEQPYYPIPTDKHYSLNHNCRTTRKVHDLMMYYHNKIQPDSTRLRLAPVCKGPEGRNAEIIKATPEDEQIKLDKLLTCLTRDEGVHIENIVLLTPTKKQKSRFHDGRIADGQFYLSWGSNGETGRDNILSCSSIHSFKGLERDIVILAELDNLRRMPEPDKLLYVALSRTRFHIIVLGNYSLIPLDDPFLPDYPDEIL